MGGLSAAELLDGPTVPREGDFVENCLKNLPNEAERLDDEDDPDHDSDPDWGKEGKVSNSDIRQSISDIEVSDYTTIVGTELHGITVDDDYDEESTGASSTLSNQPQLLTITKPH